MSLDTQIDLNEIWLKNVFRFRFNIKYVFHNVMMIYRIS